LVRGVTDRRYICRKTGGTPVPPELPPQLLPNHTRRARVQRLPTMQNGRGFEKGSGGVPAVASFIALAAMFKPKTLAPLFPRVQICRQSVATPLLKAPLLRLPKSHPAP